MAKQKKGIITNLYVLKALRTVECTDETQNGFSCAPSGYSPWHFSRLCKATLGDAPATLRRRLALQNAAQRLITTNCSVIDAAFHAGYNSAEAFTRAFSKLFGLPPQKWQIHMLRQRQEHLKELAALPFLPFDLKGDDFMNLDVRIEYREPFTVATLRWIGPYDQCGQGWETLAKLVPPEARRGAPLTRCYDDPDIVEAEKLRMNLSYPIEPDFVPTEPVTVEIIDGGDFAVATLKGPYDGLIDLYRVLYSVWLPESKRQPRGNCSIEIYRTDPCTTAPEDYLTDVLIPLEAIE